MDSKSKDVKESPTARVNDQDVLTEAKSPTAFKTQVGLFAYFSPVPNSSSKSKPDNMPNTRRGRSTPAVKTEPDTAPTRSSRKRESDDESTEQAAFVPPAKKARTTTKQRSSNDPHDPVNNLVDSLRPGLTLVFIGLNPGLMTAATGHAYAHPTNHFWRLLHSSGVTTQRHQPSETRDLMDLYSIGNTNICARPTRSGDGLSKEELVEGAGILEKKIAEYKPEAVCIVGKGIWDVIYKAKTGRQLKTGEFKYGWQDKKLWLGKSVKKDSTLEWNGARTFVATTTSGLAANMTPDQKLAIWKPLGDWIQQKRDDTVKEEEVKAEEDE